jgi:hypothetical protein
MNVKNVRREVRNNIWFSQEATRLVRIPGGSFDRTAGYFDRTAPSEFLFRVVTLSDVYARAMLNEVKDE